MTANSTDSGAQSFDGLLNRIRSSTFIKIAVFGIVLILLGAFVLSGNIAAMFGIWGATAILIGLVGFSLAQYFYRP